MKHFQILMLALVALAIAVPAFASKNLYVRMDVAENRIIGAAVDVSTTDNFYVPSPVKGYIKAVYCANDHTAATQGATPTFIYPWVDGVSLTTVSLTVVSGTAVGGTISNIATAASYTANNAIDKGDDIRLYSDGGQTVGGPANCLIELVPNYY